MNVYREWFSGLSHVTSTHVYISKAGLLASHRSKMLSTEGFVYNKYLFDHH